VLFLYVLENQFVVARFFILLHPVRNSGQFPDYQFTGGIDDTARAEMTADGR
jgi:hypothetical protein